MAIKHASFFKSSYNNEQCPPADKPEYAFIGRSNVGKSSLINMLTGRKALAKTSSTPGKTQLINHFLIDNSWFLVDLPGYGFAKTNKSNRQSFARFTTNYLEKRENLLCTFVLIDSRIPPQKIDLRFIQFLGEKGVPFAIVFTKADKVNLEARKKAMRVFQETMLKEWEELPTFFMTSANKNIGKEDVLGFIEELNKSFAAPTKLPPIKVNKSKTT